MEKNEIEKGKGKKSTVSALITVVFLIIYITLAVISLKTGNDMALIAISASLDILILCNMRYIILNNKKVSGVKLYQNVVTETTIHPLELYMIDCIWNHKKGKFSKRQIYAALLYEFQIGHIEITDVGIRIPETVNLDELNVYSLITLEMSLFNKIDCRKIRRLKMMKLKNLQVENISVVFEDIKDNVSDNTSDTHLFREQTEEMKVKYFEDIETSNTAYLTILSWICTILTAIIVITFYNKEVTVLNFYLPATLAVILIATLTSKNRERVTIRENMKPFISDALNYVRYLNNPDRNRMNDLYAYCLNKSNDSRIISPFNS